MEEKPLCPLNDMRRTLAATAQYICAEGRHLFIKKKRLHLHQKVWISLQLPVATQVLLRYDIHSTARFLKVRKEKLPDCFTGLNNLVYFGIIDPASGQCGCLLLRR